MSTADRNSLFHPGELLVQERAGVADVAAKVGRGNLADRLDPDFAAFLGERYFLVAAFPGADGRVWASLLAGRPGFARACDAHTVVVAARPAPGDPLASALAEDGAAVSVGLLAIDQATRGRIRLNGTATRTADGTISVALLEVFGNCPKYIGRRVPTELIGATTPAEPPTPSARLDAGQRALVAQTDTAFVGSAHAERGADASHRGGRPGFLEPSADGTRITLPDYFGNRMFQTLGNLALDPRIGMLVVDFDSGRILQVSGTAEIVWDGPDVTRRPGAHRVVEIAVEAVLDRARGFPARLELLEPSRVNPPLAPG